MKFSIFQDSRIGGRANNEDRIGYRYTREALVMVLADGLGGHGHGEVAAEAAVRSVIAAFDQEAQPRLDDPESFVVRALAGAHAAILVQSGLRQLDDLPRTTCVVCVVQEGVAWWSHAGDSRLYVLRGGKVLTKSVDHVRVDTLYAAGSPRTRSVLTNCLGGDHGPSFDPPRRHLLRPGDVVLLCSDGLWAPLASEEILAELAAGDVARRAPAFLDRLEASAGQNRDNLSLLLMAWHGNHMTKETT